MIERRDGRVYVRGPITLENALGLREQMGSHLRELSQCVIDFSDVTEIDSAAVSLMLEWVRAGRAAGAHVRFAGLGDSVSSLINLYGVEELIPSS